jgi:hypothetical protein
MRSDLESRDAVATDLIELGSVSELTQGDFMPLASESVTLKDRFVE